MKKLASVLLFVALLASCKKNKNNESVVNADSLETEIKTSGLLEAKQYYLVRKIEKKEFPSGKNFKIDGVLKDQNQKSDFKNIELVLQDSANRVVRRATVKADGKFTFYKVESGNYRVGLDSSTMLATAERIRITKTEDFVKDDIADKFQVGKKVSQSEINDRFLVEIQKDSLIKKNATKIIGTIYHTANKGLPRLVTYLLVDAKSNILRRVEWHTKDNLSFSQLFPNNYKILTLDPIPGARMKLKYIENVQKEIAKIGSFKLGDVIDDAKMSSFATYTFKADTLNENVFKGVLTHNGEIADEGKLLLLASNKKIVHEIATSQSGTFQFDGLDNQEVYTIVVPTKDKGYKIKHTNPRMVHQPDELDTLEQQLMKRRTIDEVLSQNFTPVKYDDAKVKKCLERVTQKLANKPDDAELHYIQGVLFYELEEYNGAIEALNKATQLKSDYADAYQLRGDSKDVMGDYEGAVQDYTKNLEYDNGNLVTHYKRGFVRKDIGQAAEAVEDLTKVINAQPDHHYPYFYRGLARYQIGKYNDALADFDKALSIEPNLVEAYFNKGLTNMHQKRFADAITNFNKAIEMNPNDADAFLLRGQAKSGVGKPTEANLDFDKAIQLNPNLDVAYYEKANIRYTLGDKDGANKIYDEAVAKFPNDYEPYYQRGVFYYNIRDNKTAIVDLDRAAGLYDKDPYVFYFRALVNQKLRNKSTVCDDSRKAINLGFDDSTKELQALIDKYCK